MHIWAGVYGTGIQSGGGLRPWTLFLYKTFNKQEKWRQVTNLHIVSLDNILDKYLIIHLYIQPQFVMFRIISQIVTNCAIIMIAH